MQKVYENIKSLRKAAKMTQEELAKRAGYTDRSSIAKIESGQVDLPQSKITLFAQIFGISVESILGLDPQPPAYEQIAIDYYDSQLFSEQKKKPIHEDGLSKTQRELIEAVRDLSEEDAAMLLAALSAKRK